MGQRRRGPRARLPRHLPGGRVLAPGRQHPAGRGGGPALRPDRRRPGPGHRDRLRGPDRPRPRHLPARAQDRPHRPPRARRRPRASAPPSACRRETIYQAIQQALHVTTTTRQSRKGEISSWKALRARLRREDGRRGGGPGDAGRGRPVAGLRGRGRRHRVAARRPAGRVRGAAARGRASPSGRSSTATPRSTRPSTRRRRSIDLARRMRGRIGDLSRVSEVVIHTSHHTHNVIGTGSGDPQKMDPGASRETLDHSIAYIVAVALQDGAWHHERSYAPDAGRAARHRARSGTPIRTVEDPEWTRRYHAAEPEFGGRDRGDPGRRRGHRGRAGRGRRASRAARDPSAARSTSPSSAASPTGCSRPPSRTASWPRRRRSPSSAAGDLPGLTIRADAGPARPRGGARHLRPVSGLSARHGHPTRAGRAGRRSGRASPPGGSCACPARSRPWSRWPSRTPASRASTSRAPRCRPTSGCPTSGLTTLSEVAGRGAADRPRDVAAHADRRRHRLRRGDERGPHGPGARGRRPGGLPPGGPGQPEALRPPRQQDRWCPTEEMVRRIARGGPGAPRPGFRDLRAHRRARAPRGSTRRSGGRERYVDAGRRHGLPRGARRRARVRGLPRGDRRAAARQHDRVRQVPAPRRRGARVARHERRDLPGHHPAPGDGRRRGGPARHRRRRAPRRALVPRMQTRARLYELLGYADYAALDADVFNFSLTDQGAP